MTDVKDAKNIVLHQWDKSAAALAKATTVSEIACALVFTLEAVRPLIVRETVTDEECRERMANCPARAVLVSGNARPALVALINQFPWVGLLGIVAFIVWNIVQYVNKG